MGFAYGSLVGLDVMAGHANADWTRSWIQNCRRRIRIRNGSNHAGGIHSHRRFDFTADSIDSLMGRTNLTICRYTDSAIRGSKLGCDESKHRHLDGPLVRVRAPTRMTRVVTQGPEGLQLGRSLL